MVRAYAKLFKADGVFGGTYGHITDIYNDVMTDFMDERTKSWRDGVFDWIVDVDSAREVRERLYASRMPVLQLRPAHTDDWTEVVTCGEFLIKVKVWDKRHYETLLPMFTTHFTTYFREEYQPCKIIIIFYGMYDEFSPKGVSMLESVLIEPKYPPAKPPAKPTWLARCVQFFKNYYLW